MVGAGVELWLELDLSLTLDLSLLELELDLAEGVVSDVGFDVGSSGKWSCACRRC